VICVLSRIREIDFGVFVWLGKTSSVTNNHYTGSQQLKIEIFEKFGENDRLQRHIGTKRRVATDK
jgi:hypothetical protein